MVDNDISLPWPSADAVRVGDRVELRFKGQIKPTGRVYFIEGPSEREGGWKVAAPIVDGVAVLDAVKDLDGDGDLLWRHVRTNATYAWFLQGTCVVAGR